MKAVLLSVRPQWCKKICHQIGTENGKPVYEKPLEVRKNSPKIQTPFKCYIYCTTPKKFYKISEHMATSAEYLHLCDGKVTMSDGFEFFGREDYEVLNCKVIGEFVCDECSLLSHSHYGYIQKHGRISKRELLKYMRIPENRDLQYSDGCWGWHISDLKIYDKPKELIEFQKPIMPTGLRYEDDTIKRPPQSWCYVEELT